MPYEGENFLLYVSVVNGSKREGSFIPVTFSIRLRGEYSDGTEVFPIHTVKIDVGANTTATVSESYKPKSGSVGMNMSFLAEVLAPDGSKVHENSINIPIIPKVHIIYQYPLKKGYNQVAYQGPPGLAPQLMRSILPYLIIAYHWNGVQYTQVVSDTHIDTWATLLINVSQDILWTIS